MTIEQQQEIGAEAEVAAEEVEILVSFTDEPEPEADTEEQPAPAWVKDLRKAHRETQKENKALRKQLETLEKPKPKEPELRAKPKLSDFDYDEEQFDQSIEAWYVEKSKYEQHQKQKEESARAVEQEWQDKLNAYATGKQEMGVSDYDDAEAEVQNLLDGTQQGLIVQGADNPAALIYALGKKPDVTAELAKIKDPVKFAFAVAKLEKDLKMTKKGKTPPPPESRVKGASAKSGATDATLEKLMAEADRTGDRTRVIAYRKQMKRNEK